MENGDNMDSFIRLIVMNGQGGTGKSYTIDTVLTTLVNEYGLDEDCYSKLATTGKATCLIGGYNLHIHQFGMGIPVGNKNKINIRLIY